MAFVFALRKFAIKSYILLSRLEVHRGKKGGREAEEIANEPSKWSGSKVPWHVLIRGLSCECYDYCSLESFEWKLARHD